MNTSTLKERLEEKFSDVQDIDGIPHLRANGIVNDRLANTSEKVIAFIEKEVEQARKEAITGETSDGYHTFNELYEFRKLYNAAFFNEITRLPLAHVHKSKRHHDGEECFGGGWFIVTATLPTGQISNHYELKDWNLFTCEVRERADEWDGHTPQDVIKRLTEFLTPDITDKGI